MTPTRRGVTLRDLLAAHGETRLTAHHLPAHGQWVRDIVLVTDVDRILSVRTDSMILLGEELALGGWMVSVALRYAWERRAVALIVSDTSVSETVVELARRFDVGLFTSAEGIDATALALARELGALEAGVLTRLDTLHSRILRATTTAEVLGQLSHELGDARVDLLVGGVSLRAAGRSPEGAEEVRTPVLAGGTAYELAAAVTKPQQEFALQAMSRAVPVVRAILLAQEIDDLTRAAPLLSFTALTGLRDFETGVQAPAARALHPLPEKAALAAVVVRALNRPADAAGRIGPVITSHWRRSFPRTPLAPAQSGWFAFLPLGSPPADVLADMSKLASTAWRGLGVALGVAVDAAGSEDPRTLLRRAWLAARVAEPGGVVDFRRIGESLLPRLLPAEDAAQVARTVFPVLTADPHAPDVVDAVVAYLDCAGSVAGAADRLGVHRNTMQARLRRAAQLGVRLDDPDLLLSTHLLLTALQRASARGGEPSVT